jgi:negative regulator of sigma E activity
MSEETLSALLDGECSPEELDRLLEQMDREPGMKQAYSRLCLSREAREGTRISREQACICAGVMAGLDEAPLPASDKLVDLDSRRPGRRATLARWKPLAGFAAAASFGAVAVLVTMPQAALVAKQGDVAPGFAPAAVTAPVSLPLPSARPQGLRAVSASAAEIQQMQEDDLSNYLIEHSNTAASRGMGGTLSYARFAAHNAVYRPQAEEQR